MSQARLFYVYFFLLEQKDLFNLSVKTLLERADKQIIM